MRNVSPERLRQQRAGAVNHAHLIFDAEIGFHLQWRQWETVMQADETRHQSISDRFSHVAQWSAQQCGRAHTFIVAILLIFVWAGCGPAFHYSDTWQLVINTGTTIVTFLMVFLIQNTQNRDTTAIQMKLDELIRANANAHNRMTEIENMTENEIKRLKEFVSESAPGATD